MKEFHFMYTFKFDQRYSSCCEKRIPIYVENEIFQTTTLFEMIFFGMITQLLGLVSSNIQFYYIIERNEGL